MQIRASSILLFLYVFFINILFFFLVKNDLESINEYRFYADHFNYVYALETLGFLPTIAFNPNYFGPCLLLIIFNYDFIAIFAFNVCVLLLVYYYTLQLPTNTLYFWIFNLSSPILLFSMFSVNKEIISLLSTILYFLYLKKSNTKLLVFILLSSILVRKELALVFVLSIFFTNDKFFFFKNINKCIIGLVIFISLIYPYVYNDRFESFIQESEATVNRNASGGLSIYLSNIQNYPLGYIIVLVPKVLQNLVGSLTNISNLFSLEDMYNNFAVILQCFVFLIQITIIGLFFYIGKIKVADLSLTSRKIFYSAIIYCICFSVLPIIQTRYFFPVHFMFSYIIIDLIEIKKRKLIVYR